MVSENDLFALFMFLSNFGLNCFFDAYFDEYNVFFPFQETTRNIEIKKKAELEREIKEERFTLQKKAGPAYTANYWEIFREILSDDKKVVNDFVCCSLCSKVFTYITKRGTGKFDIIRNEYTYFYFLHDVSLLI